MDVTFRRIDGSVFRKFKARCAELDMSLGEGFNMAAKHWIGGVSVSRKLHIEANKDLHTLTDLGMHIQELHMALNKPKAHKR